MRIRRRLAFATPFVLVIGCKTKPAEEPVRPEDEDDDDSGHVQRPEERGLVDVSHFPIRDPDPSERVIPEREAAAAERREASRRSRCGDPGVTCNPPPPPCGERGSTCNPPRVFKSRILKLEVAGDSTLITIGHGTRDAVNNGTKGCLLDQADTCVRGGEVVIIRANERTALAKLKLTVDQVSASSKMVKITPE